MDLRPMVPDDHVAVLAINQESVHLLAPLDAGRLSWLVSMAVVADVVEVEGEVAAFVLVFTPDTDYDSGNYAWFRQHYDAFWYLDRIAVASTHRRLGIGNLIYESVEQRAAEQDLRVMCEVNLIPPNHGSLAFHQSRNYTPVGERQVDEALKVQMLKSPDPSTRQ